MCSLPVRTLTGSRSRSSRLRAETGSTDGALRMTRRGSSRISRPSAPSSAPLGPDFDLGLALFIEGEEEFGSRSFKNFLTEHQDQLAADVIVVADSDNWDIDTPALTVGLRGNVTFKLTVRTLAHASHSGMFGGAVPDAMLAMVKLLATLHDERRIGRGRRD